MTDPDKIKVQLLELLQNKQNSASELSWLLLDKLEEILRNGRGEAVRGLQLCLPSLLGVRAEISIFDWVFHQLLPVLNEPTPEPAKVGAKVRLVRTILQESTEKVVHDAVGLFKIKGWDKVLTLSYSTTCLRTIQEWVPSQVVVLESRPGSEGIRLAEEIAQIMPRTQVVLVPDAEGPAFVKDTDVVLLGVDYIFPDGSISNKVGSLGLAIVAAMVGVPVVAVGTQLKRMERPSTEYRPVTCQPKELVAEPELLPPNVEVLAHLFEVVPKKFLNYSFF